MEESVMLYVNCMFNLFKKKLCSSRVVVHAQQQYMRHTYGFSISYQHLILSVFFILAIQIGLWR